MKSLSAHEQIRLKITAFLFNNRADALRGEMYRALCLHVMTEVDEFCTREDIVGLVAYAIGSEVKVTDSLRTTVLDELRRLADEGVLRQSGEYYCLREDETRKMPDEKGQEQLYETILEELRKVAVSLNPRISRTQLNSLLEFYVEVSTRVSQLQLAFISRGQDVQELDPEADEISVVLSESIERYKLDQFIDAKQFITKSLIRPSEVLVNYLHRLIQVNVVTQLLTWDPALEYLQNTVLSEKTLYLDSSILFALMQPSHDLHHFLTSLLRASRNDLRVKIKVHEITLHEYRQVMEWADIEFTHRHHDLRNIARLCLRDNSNPADYLESSILGDFLNTNLEHVDLGSWQRYYNSMTGRSLTSTLDSLSVQVDNREVFVPKEEFWEIKDALLRASKIQMERGRRSKAKDDTTHDAKIYYLIDTSRRKKHHSELSLGYDIYLLTLDGSLAYFARLYRIPLPETYFLFSNQWYELTFPFLRIRASENPDFAAGLTSLVFSSAFPALKSLIPLELCTYVFDLGGTDLPMGSIQNVVEGFVEKKLVDSLDPKCEDQRKREEARLQVQRMIAQEELKHRKTLQQMEEFESATEALKQEHSRLETSVQELTTTQEVLTAEVSEREAKIGEYEEIDARFASIQAECEERITELQAKHNAELDETRKTLEQEMKSLLSKDKRLQEVQETLKAIEGRQKEDTKEREKAKRKRARQMITLKKSVITILMLAGLLFNLAWLFQFTSSIIVVLFSIGFMGWGLSLYHWLSSGWWSLIVYGLGATVAAGVIMDENGFTELQWIIPMVLEFMVLGVEKVFKQQSSRE